jgi:2-methylcitrate dehydratase
VDPVVSQLVDFATQVRFEDLSEAAVHASRQRVVDTVGCAFGGFRSPPAHVARRLAYPVTGGGGARIWGSQVRTTPEAATFANGIALRYLDFNDAYRGSVDVGHPSDNMGALFAAAEERHATGRALVEGLTVAYEVQCRFAEAVPLNDRGWDQPTSGVIAAALGTGRILGLSVEQLAEAVALAIVPNMAMHQARVPELTWWKGCAAAMGARQGLFAARMAEAGMEGPHDPIVGKNGLWAQLGVECQIPPLGAGPVLGIQQSNIKTWPVRDSCQLAIDTARDVLAKGVDAREITSVRVDTYSSSFRNAAEDMELWKPQTRETADHSLPFSVAVTLLDGEVSAQTFDRKRFLDGDVLDLIGRMTVEVDDDFSAQTPGVKNCRIAVATASGDTQVAHRALTQEEVEAGLPDDIITAKFTDLTADLLLPSQLSRLLVRLWHVEEVDDVATLVDDFDL